MRAILILALVAGIALAGCTKPDDSTTPTTNSTNTTATPTPTPTPDPSCINPVGPVCVTPPAPAPAPSS
ncbi:MAG TPA: hypothetical protein VM370_13525 [Candidatus Thermoplasmatota archaeon]|nr:hypothetical protein [Candidatus Thermoplasmatota archaeon]